jgi:hypothetical protein
MLMKLVLQLCLFCLSVSHLAYANRAINRQLSEIVQKVDILFMSESHEIHEQAIIFQEFLASPAALQFKNIGTEYVPAAMQDVLDQYINDPAATKGSSAEEAFFAKLTQATLIWPRTEDGRNIFRSFWKLKRRNPQLRVYAIDQPYGSKEQNKTIWLSLPEVLKNKILTFSKMSEADIIDKGFNYLRDAKLAANMAAFVSTPGKDLIHIGAYHAISIQKFKPTDWLPSTFYLNELLPSEKMFSVFTAIAPEKSSNSIIQALAKWTRLTNINQPMLLSSTQFEDSQHREALIVETTDKKIFPAVLWDGIIVGPPGHNSELLPDHNPEAKPPPRTTRSSCLKTF